MLFAPVKIHKTLFRDGLMEKWLGREWGRNKQIMQQANRLGKIPESGKCQNENQSPSHVKKIPANHMYFEKNQATKYSPPPPPALF